MIRKKYILALTFLCLLCGELSYGFDAEGNEDDYWQNASPPLNCEDLGGLCDLLSEKYGSVVTSIMIDDEGHISGWYSLTDDPQASGGLELNIVRGLWDGPDPNDCPSGDYCECYAIGCDGTSPIYHDTLTYCDFFPEVCEYGIDNGGESGDDTGEGSFVNIHLINTLANNTSAYKTISERNNYYKWVNTQISYRDIKWFEAADIVTRPWGIGAADGINLGVLINSSEAFLKQGNEYLFPFNMENAKNLITNGGLTGSFISAAGEVISFDGKTGIDLDFAIVEFEQTKVSAFITEFQTSNGLNDAEMDAICDDISASMWWAPPFTYIREIMKDYFDGGSSFDFCNYRDRVILGQALIDQLHSD